MKIPRSWIGRRATVVWRDPCSAHVKSHVRDHSDVPRGPAVLATQEEEAVIMAIEDGVVTLRHTLGRDSSLVPDPTDDLYLTWVPEAAVESVTLWVQEAPTAKNGEAV
jgi:hypothetical protein